MKIAYSQYFKNIFFIFSLILTFFFFIFYFKLWRNDLPLPFFDQKKFFNFTLPEYFFLSQELKKQNLPLWNPLKGGGSPVIAQDYHTTFNPLNFIFLKFFSFYLGIKLIYLFYFFFYFLGIFIFLRKLNFSPSIIAWGIIFFIFSGSFISNISNLPNFQSLSFLPWIFFFSILLQDQRNFKNIVLLGLIFAFQILSGPIDVFLNSLFFLIVFLIFIYYINKKNKELIPFIFSFVLAIFFSFGISSIKIFSFKSFDLLTNKSLLYFFSLSYRDSLISSLYSPFYSPSFSLYVGSFPFLFFLGGLIFISINFFTKRKITHQQLSVLIFLFLGFFCFLMIFPKKSPLYFLYLFPPFNLVKDPKLFSSFFTWFLLIAGAFSLKILENKNKILSQFLILGSIGELLIFNFSHFPKETVKQKMNDISKNYPILDEIRKDDKRIFFVEFPVSKNILPLQANNNILWNISSFNNDFIPTQRYSFFLKFIYSEIEIDKEKNECQISPSGLKLLQIAKIDYLVSNCPFKNLDSIFQRDVYFYKLDGKKKYQLTINKIIKASTSKEIFDLLTSVDFDFFSTAIIDSYSPPNKELTVISQVYFPGWKAKLKNKEIKETIPVNLSFIGIPESEKNLEKIFFEPQGLKIGIVLTIFFILFSFFILLKGGNTSFF